MSQPDLQQLSDLLSWMFTEAGLRRLVDALTEDGSPDSWDLPGEQASRAELAHAVVVAFERQRRLDRLQAHLQQVPGWSEVVVRVFEGGTVAPLPEPVPEPVGERSAQARRAPRFPRPAVRVVGRQAQIDELRAAVDAGDRLICLVGPPGIGRTTVLTAWASQDWIDQRQRPAWFARLADTSGLAGFGGAVAEALGLALPAADTDSLMDAIGEALAEHQDALLALDHMDRRVRDAAPAVARWLAEVPGLRVVMTSTEPPALPGRVLEIPPLDDASGVALFVERAQQAGATLTDAPETHEPLTQLVRRLGGLPLAIELMAGCAPGLSLPELVEAARVCLDLLASMGETGLQLALEASFEQLDPAQRQAMQALACFEGGFFASEAAAVLPGAPAVLGTPLVLPALLRRSLVLSVEVARLGGVKRWRMHEVVRQLALRHLAAAGREAEARARHRAAMIAGASTRVDALSLEGWERAMAWLRLELDNLVAALRAAEGAEDRLRLGLAIDGAMALCGPAGALLEFLDLSLGAPGGPADLRAATLVARAVVRRNLVLGLPEALADLDQALALTAASEICAAALRVRSSVLRLLGRVEEAEAALDRALALPELGARARGQVLGELASVLHARGQLPRAEIACREAVAALREARDTRSVAVNMGNLGVLIQARGASDEASACHEEALALFEAAEQLQQVGLQHGNLGNIALQRGRLDEAERHYRASQRALLECGAARQLVTILSNLALARFDAGARDEAIAQLSSALDRARRLGLRRQEALVSANLAVCQLRARRDPGLLAGAVAAAESSGDRRLLAYTLAWRAGVTEDPEAARADLARATELAAEGGDLGVSAAVTLHSARVGLRLGDIDASEARRLLAEAREGEAASARRWRSAREAAEELEGALELQGA